MSVTNGGLSLGKCVFCDGRLGVFWRDPLFVRCADCGLITRSPFPNEVELNSLYETSWVDPNVNIAETGSMDGMLAKQYVRELLKSVGRDSAEGMRILDFGAGKGALMNSLEELGAEIYGIEPYGYEELLKSGRTVYRTLDDIPQGLSFDGIISMDVVEHLREPWEIFTELFGLLKVNGWLCLSTPNPKGINARITRGRWREAHKPGHILFTEERTLVRMLRHAGFNDVRPVHWRVRYREGFLHNLFQRVTLSARVHSAVRVLAYKRGGPDIVPA